MYFGIDYRGDCQNYITADQCWAITVEQGKRELSQIDEGPFSLRLFQSLKLCWLCVPKPYGFSSLDS